MALVLANRVQETSTTTGTGTLTLAGAVLGYQTFAAGIGAGNTCYYAITSTTGAWEVGIGTVGTGTLARTTLLSSSTGSLVSFTGTLNVYVTYPSEKSVNLDAANIITGYPITVKDNVFTLQDDVDPTKQAQFQLSSVNTGTTRVYTTPNADATLAGLNVPQNWTSAQTFTAASNTFGSSAGATTTGVGTGATTTGNTKTVNIGTGGVSGSTTAIAIGGTAGTSTTTMNGTTVIGGAAGNQSLQVNNVASAVNYAQIVGAVTGSPPTISAQGADTNIALYYQTKGSGNQFFAGNGGVQFGIGNTLNPVNYPYFYGSISGNGVVMTAAGSDANISYSQSTKGTGNYNFYTGSFAANQVIIAHTASAVNYLNFTGAATTAAPTISAQGSDANIGLVLSSKGTGAVALGGTTAANSAVQITPLASAVNYALMTGATTGTFPSWSAQGTDTNVGLRISTKGIANLNFMGNNFGHYILTGNAVASAVNFLQVLPAVTTSAPELSAQGSDTNINLKLTPKGTGGVQFTGPLLPNNLAGTSGQVLTSAGAGAVPTWAAAVSSNITANGLFENNATISANYTIGSGNNAVSAGPITINSGVVVTVPSGSTWVVV